MPTFIKGLDLSEAFYHEAVKPILNSDFPQLRYSAGLIGPGSEVLGFDTEQSTDHEWGPRLFLFLSQADHPLYTETIKERLQHKLPYQFRGYSTNFVPVPEGQTAWLEPISEGPVNHRVSVRTVEATFQQFFGLDLSRPLTALDWLTTPQQMLLSLTSGRIFHDGLGTLKPLQAQFAYYPHDLWLYFLAAGWRRIAQEEAFMGRNGQVGDELGSQVIASRLVHDLMALGFLMEKRYIPYPKWFGPAFAQLHCAAQLTPLLQGALSTAGWQAREKYLSAVYTLLAEMHNALGITQPLSTAVSNYYNRPFKVIYGDRFADSILAAITAEEVRRLPPHLGGIDQWANSTDVLSHPERCKQLTMLYEPYY